LNWANNERGPLDYNVAFYVQATPDLNNLAESVTASFSNIMYMAIPEPATGALSLLGLTALAARRRKSA
jgi:hypothetical protein